MPPINTFASRVQAADNLNGIDEIRSAKVQAFVKSFASKFEVKALLTDGLNEEDTGVSSCEIIFVSGDKSSLGYNANVLAAKALQTLGQLCTSTNGLELELNMGEGDDEFHLFVGDGAV